MHFATPLPWWLAVLVAAAIAGLAVFSYRRPLVPLTRLQQGTLMALRALALGAVVFFLCRPILLLPPRESGDVVVPILVDVSRSMRVADVDGESRIARARAVVEQTLVPGLTGQARPEILAIGASTTLLSPASLDVLQATGRRSDVTAAIAAAQDRYRGRRVPGIVLLSDGGDTSLVSTTTPSRDQTLPVLAIGIGSADGLPDREVVGLTAGDPRLDQSLVDLHVSMMSRGFGRTPFQLRVLANGQMLETRRIVPLADGSPIDETFSVSPDPLNPTVYAAEVVGEQADAIAENNSRSILVSPASRKRRVLALAGAPGYEHSFLVRALAHDPGLEVDSVIRKGKNESNQDTFLVQAGGGRAAALTTGFPSTRQALFAYDALIVANLESDFFTRAQLSMAADFVGERGGGVLVLGGRSFESRSLIGTPMENVLPVELSDRRGGTVTPSGDEAPTPQNTVALTPEGQNHPIMRVASTSEATRKFWATLPALAANAAVGGPRPGASVLAVTTTASGTALPVVAVQRYGRGRSMVFAGEASWRWRMMQPSTDRGYEFFWRQSLRWLSSEAPEPVTVSVSADPEPGDTVTVDVDVRDRDFVPVPDAVVDASLTAPGDAASVLPLRRVGDGRVTATLTPERPGLYRVRAEAKRPGTTLGAADRWLLVGGGDREFADPRLNEEFLRRLARESGGRYVRSADADSILDALRGAIPQQLEMEQRDLWHEPWAFALVIGLLAAEWILRRRWGLR